jgi:hypothetical protein
MIRYFIHMSRTHLVAEQRPTKDGLLVTRWVKEEKKAGKKSGKNNPLPAPGIAGHLTDSDKKKDAARLSIKMTSPKDDSKGQKAARKAENARQLDYIQTEAKLRIRYKGHRDISGMEVSGVLKALRDGGFEDPSNIVDEDLLISYREFRDLAWTPYNENKDHSIELLNDSELFRTQVNKLSAHYVTHPEDRERLAKVVRSGVYDHEAAMKALNASR